MAEIRRSGASAESSLPLDWTATLDLLGIFEGKWRSDDGIGGCAAVSFGEREYEEVRARLLGVEVEGKSAR